MGRRYRIAMVAACPFPYPRGTPVRIYRMAQALGQRGHEVHVLSYHLGQECRGEGFTVHRIANVPTYRKLVPGPTYQKLLVLDTLLAYELARLLHREAIDLIHAHHYEGLLAGLVVRWWQERCGRRRWPLIYDAHTLLESELPFYRLGLCSGAKQWVGRALDGALPRRASHVIAVTPGMADRLVHRHGVAPNRVSVISNGVELAHFIARDASPNAKAKASGNGVHTIVFAGNLAGYQGIDLLIQLFEQLRARRRDVRLRIISEQAFTPYVRLAKRLGIWDALELVNVGFSALPDQLADADVAVNPRTGCDGIPQKLLNYMAAGKPIVSFAGSAKGLRHRHNGWIVQDGDVTGFAQAIDHLLNHPIEARRLGRNARADVTADWSWARVAERVEAVYDRATGSAPSEPSRAGLPLPCNTKP